MYEGGERNTKDSQYRQCVGSYNRRVRFNNVPSQLHPYGCDLEEKRTVSVLQVHTRCAQILTARWTWTATGQADIMLSATRIEDAFAGAAGLHLNSQDVTQARGRCFFRILFVLSTILDIAFLQMLNKFILNDVPSTRIPLFDDGATSVDQYSLP